MNAGEVVAVPRGERPLAPGDGPVVRFARDLRSLREKAGSPTYRELSFLAHYSPAALSEAASGRKLPSLAVTVAYVTACGGDITVWENRWRHTAAELTAARSDRADGEPAPYVGLAAFQEEDAEKFFGRDELVADLTARLAQRRFIGVFGSSGSGKSSVLRAGLVASLSADGVPVVVFTPGEHPVEECAVHLAAFLGQSSGALRDEFLTQPRGLHLRVRQAAVAAGTDLVLVVDQFEELFTLCGDESERAAFIDALVTAATDPGSRTRVVLGVRADFLGHCGQHSRLVSALDDGQVLVGPMTTDELRLAITGPAERAGYRVETALVARLVADAARQPGTLPLISHALLQTWLRRQGTVMTLAGYDAVGGIEHALARSAEEVYQALDGEGQDVAKQVFLRLTALGQGTEDTKRRIARGELDRCEPSTALVLDTLATARLITVGHGSVEITHEALIRHWPRLRDWLAEDREGHRRHRQLTDVATEWAQQDRDEGLLYRGARLAAWQDRPLDRLNDTERAFLAASRHAARRERQSRRRHFRVTVGVLGVAVAMVTALAVLAGVVVFRAEDERATAMGYQLAEDARAQLDRDPELALLLAREAYAVAPNGETEAVLRQATADSRIRGTVHGREEPMVSVAFSQDGHQLATGGHSELRVWDRESGRVLRSRTRALANYIGASTFRPVFSADLRHVAETDSSGAVWVRDWVDGAEPVRLLGHGSMVSSLAFSQDGRWVAGGGQDGVILVWEASGGKDPVRLSGHPGNVLGLAFSPNGERLASVGTDGTVRVWDLVGGAPPTVWDSEEYTPRVVAFSPDGRHVATGHADGGIRVWDPAATGSVPLGEHAGAVESVTYSPDGRLLASTGIDGTVRIWNADHPGAPPVVLRGHQGTAAAAAFSPDGRFVASAGFDGTAKIWEVEEVQDLTVFHGHDGPVRAVDSSPDGRRVASGGEDGTVRIWDVAGGGEPAVLRTRAGPVRQVAFSPDGAYLAAVIDGSELRIWDVHDLAEVHSLYSGPRGRVAFSPDGHRIALNMDGSVAVRDTREFGPPSYLPYVDSPGESTAMLPVAWSPDGGHVAAATAGGIVVHWDLPAGTDPSALPGNPGQIRALAFSQDSARVASAGEDGAVHLWRTTGDTDPVVLNAHSGGVWSVAFSRDGRHLITSGGDATVRFWPSDGNGEPLVLDGFRASAPAVAALPDGRYASGHEDGSVRIWRCRACGPIAQVLADADQHVTRELTSQERRTYLPDEP